MNTDTDFPDRQFARNFHWETEWIEPLESVEFMNVALRGPPQAAWLPGQNNRTIQKPTGQVDPNTTMIYSQLLKREIKEPLARRNIHFLLDCSIDTSSGNN